jgi:hypothetical protein
MTRIGKLCATGGMAIVVVCGGCAKSTRPASPAVFTPGPLVTLGAGDALGTRVYVNDLVLAARESARDVVLTSVPDVGPSGAIPLFE